MKTDLFALLIAIALCGNLFAQAPKSFKFQAALSSSSNDVAANKIFLVEVLQGTIAGSAVFEESHTISVPETGLINMNIGSVNYLGTIDWSAGPYFLKVTIDGELLGVSPILGVPITEHAATVGQIDRLDYSDLTNVPEFDQDETDDFDGDYNSLENLPTLGITAEESDKVDLLSVTSEIDLDQISADVAVNSAKVSFPGFGNTIGTAFIQKWSKINDNLFFFGGNAAINKSLPLDFGGSTLDLGAGILLDRITPSQPTPGMFYFDDVSGEYQYYNELGDAKQFNVASQVFGSGRIDTEPDTDVVVEGKLSVGETAGEDVGQEFDGTLKLTSATPRIRFRDTSMTASFPTNDWEITVNDLTNGGDDYLAITDIDNGTRPFYVAAGAPGRIVTIDPQGNVGLKVEEPSERLDIGSQTLVATSFIGDAGQLMGLIGMGSASESNTGSTTIAADSDDDGVGDMQLQTGGVDRATIFSSGKVGIGATEPVDHLLAVGGSLFTNNLVSEIKTTFNSVSKQITVNPVLNGFSLDITTGSSVYLFQSGSASFAQLFGGVVGQRVTIINKNASSFSVFYNSLSEVLGQYQSATFENVDGDTWVLVMRS